MKIFKIPRKESNTFSTQQQCLSEPQEKLNAYIGFYNKIDKFLKQIDLNGNSYSSTLRQDLSTTLARNYEGKNYPKANASIELLKKPTRLYRDLKKEV